MKHAIFYIATKEEYIKQAALCASSVPASSSMSETVLFTTLGKYEACPWFDSVVVLGEGKRSPFFLQHTVYMQKAIEYLMYHSYQKAIFMDTDTFLCSTIDDVYEMLDYYDFMGVHAPARKTTGSVYNVPMSFPELNIGFNPFRVGGKSIELWSDVTSIYECNKETYTNNDQGPLRDVLFDYLRTGVDFRLGILPDEYNCRFNFPCAVAKTVKVLHGKTNDIRRAAEIINESGDMRSWKSGEIQT